MVEAFCDGGPIVLGDVLIHEPAFNTFWVDDIIVCVSYPFYSYNCHHFFYLF
jgi:hypothetical protein